MKRDSVTFHYDWSLGFTSCAAAFNAIDRDWLGFAVAVLCWCFAYNRKAQFQAKEGT